MLPLTLLALALPQASVVDWTPTPPPTAPVPLFVDVAPALGTAGTGSAVDDVGTGRGQAWVDVVGPGLTDPDLPGPPDGIPDLVQLNSNSPPFPIGSGPGAWTIGPVGDVHRPCLVYRREPDGSLREMAAAMSTPTGTGFGLEYPGGSPWGIAAGDTDGDGDNDLVVACGGFNTDSPNALLRNNGDGTFTFATPPGTPYQASFAAVLFDPDRDGDLDLYVGNGHEALTELYTGNPNPDPVDRFYANDGLGGYTEQAAAAGLDSSSSTFAATTTDLDLDGNPDLAVSCFKQFNKFFYGRGDGTFAFMLPDGSAAEQTFDLADLVPDVDFPGTEDFPASMLPALLGTPFGGSWSMPVEAADFNGDGWTDLFFGCWSYQLVDGDSTSALGATFLPFERAYLYLNIGDVDGDGRGEGIFNEVAQEVGLDHVGGCMGANAGDFNGDGWIDLYVGGGGPQAGQHVEEDYLYINEPTAWPADFLTHPFEPLSQAFYEVGAIAGTYVNTEMSHGTNVWRGDEGRIDLMIGNGGPAQFDEGQVNRYLRNEGNQGGAPNQSWAVTLEETASAPGAPGARVELLRDHGGGLGQVLALERAASHGFSSVNHGPLTVGTGGAALLAANSHWPSGRHGGSLYWPTSLAAGDLTLAEPEVSVHFTRAPQPDGAVTLSARVTNHASQTTFASLLLAAVLPSPDALALDGLYPVVSVVQLEEGEELALEATVENLPTGLYSLVLVDWNSLTIIEASSVWHEPGAASGVPSQSFALGAPEPERRFQTRGSLAARGTLLRVAAIESDEPRQTFGADQPVSIDLPNGDRLEWRDGALAVRAGGARPLALQVVDGDRRLELVSGAPSSCCDVPALDWVTRVTLEGLEPRSLTVDGRVLLAAATAPSAETGLPAATGLPATTAAR